MIIHKFTYKLTHAVKHKKKSLLNQYYKKKLHYFCIANKKFRQTLNSIF